MGTLEESYVDLDISRNDPSLVGLHGFAAVQPSLGVSAQMPEPDNLSEDGEGAPADEALQQDAHKLIDELSESSSESSEGSEGDGALLAGMGFANENEEEDGD